MPYPEGMDAATPSATPALTLADLQARWATADQAPAEEITEARQWAEQVVESLRSKRRAPRAA